MKSKPFEVTLRGSHAITLPETIVKPYIKNGHKRVKVHASFIDKSIVFHGALQKRADGMKIHRLE